MERKLVAILSADVVGYTRLMEIDEAGTLARLKTLRQNLIDPAIASHGGRTVKLMGDGALVEFPSVIAAVECSLAIQREMEAIEPGIAADRRIRFRIGVNVGDVIVDGDDIYGEGVNIAARLQALADPGGVAVSAAVRDHVGQKLPVGFEDFGAHSIKNLEKPLQVYRAHPSVSGAAGPDSHTAPNRERLSIAVLPFVNMSNDAEQEYFADGITEDIITELSRFKSLTVIARNSTFRYKGQSTKIQDVGRDLGVRWAVEGSVRKAANRIRITAQLIDTETGAHVWAERYDRTLQDIFEVQDEVVRAIAAAIPGHIGRAVADHMRRKPPANLTAFDCLLKGRWYNYEGSATIHQSIEFLERAIEADPNYAAAHAILGNSYAFSIYIRPTDPEAMIARALQHAERAIRIDDTDSEVQALAAATYILCGDHARADFHSMRAIELNPNDAIAVNERALVLTYLGRHAEAMDIYKHAQKLDPSIRWANPAMIDCLFMQGRYEEMLDLIRRCTEVPIYMKLVEAAAHALLGQVDQARAAIEAFNAITEPKPDPKVMMTYCIRMCARQEDRDRWLEGFRKAGLDV